MYNRKGTCSNGDLKCHRPPCVAAPGVLGTDFCWKQNEYGLMIRSRSASDQQKH